MTKFIRPYCERYVGRCTIRDEYGNADIIGVDMTFMMSLDYEQMCLVTQALNRLADYEDKDDERRTGCRLTKG